jgi:hypothetical protein
MFYPEKRQFFLEGKNYFDMNIGRTKLFYSRRIGIDQSQEVPIIGGLRFFGKLNKTGIGLMSIQTYEKDSIPTSNYSVIKIKQDIFKQSNLGFIATQKYTKGHYNQVFGTNFNYSSSKIFGNKNLLIGGTLAGSNTNDIDDEVTNTNNLAYNLFLSYPNDIVEYDFGFTTVQKEFNPEMGYVRRKNYQMIYTELQFNPRFKKLPFFRNFMFKPLDINYFINNETKKMESVFYEWRPLGFVTKNGDFIELNILHLYDHPEEDFNLFEDVSIPAGSYWDHRVEIQSHSFGGRKIAASGAVNIGSYYTGKRQQYRLYTRISFNKHLNIGFFGRKNDFQLPEKSFTTNELGGRIDYAFNPKLQTGLYAQWNNEDRNILLNYRINWIPKIGSYFYFVINQELSTENEIKLERTTILGKLIWRFAI